MSQTVYAVLFLVGSAVVAFLSVLMLAVWKIPPGIGWMWSQVAPPSVERAATTAFALFGTERLKESAEAYAIPSGPNETQGSDALNMLLSAGCVFGLHAVSAIVVSVQLAPPSVE